MKPMQFVREVVKDLVKKVGPINRLLSERTYLRDKVSDLQWQIIALQDENKKLVSTQIPINSPDPAAAPVSAPVPVEVPIMQQMNVRLDLSHKFIRGEGIEIGALHGPLPYAKSQAMVKYVDRMSVEDLYKHYPELKPHPLVPVDIIDNAEKLLTIADGSQDFIIANHLLEHCQDPIGTLMVFERKLKPGGILYLAIPDKRETFDKCREITTLQHLINDHEQGPCWSKRQHFEEWVSIWIKDRNSMEFKNQVDELYNMDYSIHYHVWTEREFLELILYSIQKNTPHFNIRAFQHNGEEFITVLQKS
jgi:predicted SAM-dependent methyltransferase